MKQVGYEICLLTHEAFEGLVRGENLEFFAVGGDPRTLVNRVMNEADADDKPNEVAIMRKLIPLIKPLRYEILERCWQECQQVDVLMLNTLGIAVAITMAVTNQEMKECAATLGKKIRGEDGVGNAVRLFQHYVP